MLKVHGIEIAQRYLDYALKVDKQFGGRISCADKTEALSLAAEVKGAIVVVQYLLVSHWYDFVTGEIVYDEMEE